MRSPNEWQSSANTTKGRVTFLNNRLIFGRKSQVNERCDVNVQIWAAAVFDDETNFLENVDRFPTGETRDWRLYLDGSNFFFVSGLQFRWRAAPKRSTEATTLVGRK